MHFSKSEVRMKIMICLVSEQTIPNILPALQLRPDIVYLISTIDQATRGVVIADFLKSKKINCEQKTNFDPYDVTAMTNRLRKIVNKRPEDSFILNVTGGTKLMALAAYSVFSESNSEIIYCNTIGNTIKYLYPIVEDIPLESNLDVRSFLAACGYSVTKPGKVILSPEKIVFFEAVKKGTIKNIHKLFETIRSMTLNFNPNMIKTGFGDFEFNKGDKSWTLSSSQYSLNITERKSFFDGFWLEEYCYWYSKKVLGLNPLSSIKILSRESTENEVDLMFVHSARLYLVSCKSGEFSKKDLIEIESLKSLAGGTFGKAFMLSLNPYSDAIIARAKQLRVKLLTPTTFGEILD